MRKIAFVNEKGGSCKTTLAVNIGAYFALEKSLRVLLVDMDAQGQVGKSLGLDVHNAEHTVSFLLSNPDLRPHDVVCRTRIQGLDVIIANKSLTDFPLSAANDADREWKLKQRFDGLRGYDYVIFDSPPSLGLVTINIMLAANEIIIPVSLTYFALDGCAEIMETVRSVKENYGRRELRVAMVVPTLYRNTNLANEILGKLQEYFPDRLAQTIIRFNVRIDEAQSHGLTIWEYDPRSTGAEMLRDLAEEVLLNA
ncbi:MAG: ParA family protein [Candidatus Abyssobacteria bacterium SURF_17]|uniref:ParA family protein n=1 Tax=Candidatus Abyssobacteria bacterium SURF_17 TaxID=2093361 RepID=A0A419F513_9BACT|nr:MAG: ParA family protein [Candidatus Abyssubacteria bacterium SURF_17]